MSVASLKKQFQKELKTNPKKAAILGLLALVAIYFWAPLATKMIGGGKSKNANRASKTATADAGKEEANAEVSKAASTTGKDADETSLASTPSGPGWDKLIQWIEKDPLTKSYPILKNEHDPFKRVEKPLETVVGEAPVATVEEASTPQTVIRDLSPNALGMRLTSTIVGLERSVAMLDERAYVQGQRVTAYDGGEKIYFRLIRVLPDQVVLERDAQEYVLKMMKTDELAEVEEDEAEL